jgi:hypothetical protein
MRHERRKRFRQSSPYMSLNIILKIPQTKNCKPEGAVDLLDNTKCSVIPLYYLCIVLLPTPYNPWNI